MKKRIISLAMVFVMIACMFVLGACDNNKKDDTQLVIGGIGPLTGAASTYGNAVKKGAELAVKEINDAGGVNGLKLVFEFQDDEHDTEKVANAYNALKDKGMQILLGAVTSDPCIAVAALSKDDNMFQLTPSGSAVECIKYDNAFRLCFNDPNQGEASAKYISENELAKKVAVLYDSSSSYSTGIYEKFISVKDTTFEVVETQTFTDTTNQNFSIQLGKIKDSGAELLFLPIYYTEAALILQQAQQINLDVKFFGCDGFDGLTDQLKDDVALADGVMLLTPFAADAQDEKTQKFTSAYKAAYNNEIPNQFAADGYDCIYAIKAALEKTDVKSGDISVSDLCEKLKKAMTEITLDGVTGEITWSANGEPTKDAKGMYISVSEVEQEDGSKKLVGSYKAM